ncbi:MULTISPECIES: CYTH domain-containing protein [unclassified Moorena]|uniref:CYTH domain-containing protein n=1 Tax=unclassified Moorena TaxID=2683338 RepID=UPI0013F721F9|nr:MULTISPECIES: CYTH domain-containing protein [unclassified Moorena]NEO11988.1 CYTH domain-containing protein [Moorena sp. SIO3E8]NEP28664.1 CYTH domain-containing protein [Moorena sp. SIO3I6]NEP97533.1 CYTH domain-containing protein [Moorena sp. SIO3F7]
MATEIERKFLVKGEEWRKLGTGSVYRQGYIRTTNRTTVRVRLVGDQGYLTIKSPKVGFSRKEYEYPIPGSDAQEMLDTLCQGPLIEKTRYKIEHAGLIWEVDEFAGDNQGLILAEVELTDENQDIELPEWIGIEVSDDPRYFNSNLVQHPYTQWLHRI